MAPTKKICPECGEELWAFHLPAHRLRLHGVPMPVKTSTPTVEGPAPEDVPPPSSPGPSTAVAELEAAPGDRETAPRKPRLLDRLRARRRSSSSSPSTGERAPRPRGRPPGGRKRVALDADISDIWAFAGRRLERTPHYPTARMLQYQAPAAGVILDRAFAGTLPDRVFFQPLARNRDKYEDVGFLLAGPLLTFSITATGQQMQRAIEAGDQEALDDLTAKLQMQREMFTWVLSMMLPRLAVGAKVAEEKKAKRDAVIAEAFPHLGDDDPVEVLASLLFTPPTTYQEASSNGSAGTTTPNPSEQGSVSFGG